MPCVYAAYEKACADKKVCVNKLAKTNKALESSLPTKALENVMEASTKANQGVKPVINHTANELLARPKCLLVKLLEIYFAYRIANCIGVLPFLGGVMQSFSFLTYMLV